MCLCVVGVASSIFMDPPPQNRHPSRHRLPPPATGPGKGGEGLGGTQDAQAGRVASREPPPLGPNPNGCACVRRRVGGRGLIQSKILETPPPNNNNHHPNYNLYLADSEPACLPACVCEQLQRYPRPPCRRTDGPDSADFLLAPPPRSSSWVFSGRVPLLSNRAKQTPKLWPCRHPLPHA